MMIPLEKRIIYRTRNLLIKNDGNMDKRIFNVERLMVFEHDTERDLRHW